MQSSFSISNYNFFFQEPFWNVDGIRTAQHSTVRRMLVPVRLSIFGTLTAFQDLPNSSYVTYKILFLHCLQVIFFYYIIVICNNRGNITQCEKFFFFNISIFEHKAKPFYEWIWCLGFISTLWWRPPCVQMEYLQKNEYFPFKTVIIDNSLQNTLGEKKMPNVIWKLFDFITYWYSYYS